MHLMTTPDIFDALLFRQGRVLQQGTVVLDDGQRRFQLV